MLRQGLEFNLRSIICQKLLPSLTPIRADPGASRS